REEMEKSMLELSWAGLREEGCVGELGAEGCEIWRFGVGSGVRGEVRVGGMAGGLF
ncbi:hypothetical protein A2U01_0086395, partial [Trifolium medium]|nr:hypothetical protein [Trifolium medium]